MFKKLLMWYKDYSIDLKKILFSFIMGYLTVIVSVLILLFMNKDLNGSQIVYSIIGCCSSLLAVAAIKIEDNKFILHIFPLMYNIIFLVPSFVVLSLLDYFTGTNIDYLFVGIIALIGVCLSFYYLIISTNKDRETRKKIEKQAKNLRENADKTTEVIIGDKSIKL